MIAMNPAAHVLLRAISLDPASVPRPRDVWVNRDLTEVTVFTRTGGGNRDDYRAENAALRAHPGYLRDHDWTIDATYAEWVFVLALSEAALFRADFDTLTKDERERVLAVITADATAKWTRMMDRLGKGGG